MEEQILFSTAELPKAISEDAEYLCGGKIKAIVKLVKISEIYPDPEKIPQRYKTEELAKLALDILQNGLKNPIATVICPPNEKLRYRILSGEKRFRACLMAKLDKIPCTVIYPTENKDDISLAMPPRDYFEQARLFKEAINRGVHTEETIAQNAGISREDVKSVLSLLVFSSDEQNFLLGVGVPPKIARMLASFDINTRRGFFEAMSAGTHIGAVCAEISSAYHAQKAAPPKPKKIMIRSSGFFFNSVNHAVETMRKGGVDIDCKTEETDTDTIMTLTVPKRNG